MYDETSSSTNFKVPITDINSLINWIEFVNQEKNNENKIPMATCTEI